MYSYTRDGAPDQKGTQRDPTNTRTTNQKGPKGSKKGWRKCTRLSQGSPEHPKSKHTKDTNKRQHLKQQTSKKEPKKDPKNRPKTAQKTTPK